VAKAIGHWMKQEFKASPIRMLGALLLTGALKAMKRKMDPETYGGAPLLGVRGICIKAHGGSSNRAIFNAIRVACESVHHHMNDMIVNEVSRMPKD
jgi:glycerol-3-phosphate acyltransferase PlsX